MKQKLLLLIVISVSVLWSCNSITEMDSKELLNRSILFHDPDFEWESMKAKMTFEEINTSDEVRNTSAWFDLAEGYFKLDRGGTEIHGMKMDSCFIEKGDVDCARAERMRDYYCYLWGLPMKLKDEGTVLLDSIGKSSWEGRDVYVLYVNYEKDNWRYYIDPDTYQMHGYDFIQTTGNSEKIILEGLVSYNNMKIPASRSWFMSSDNDRFLGKDKLVKISDWED